MDYKAPFLKIAKDLLHKTRWRRHVLTQYPYYFEAQQLCFFCDSLKRTENVPGVIVEVGVANGGTTLFLNSYLDGIQSTKSYIAIDTFTGFVAGDVAVEVNQRGKDIQEYSGRGGFHLNKKEWFDLAMKQGKVMRVRSIQADVNEFELRTLGPISFCLLDVDLYRPSKKAMRELYEVLSPGGLLVVDDCTTRYSRYDGALQAYQEFMRETNKPEHIAFGKLGLIEK